MKYMRRIAAVLLALLIMFTTVAVNIPNVYAVDGEEPVGSSQPTETPAPSETPQPTETPVPSETPQPTETPAPSETPQPTETPVPSEIPQPTETPVPSEIPQLEELVITQVNGLDCVEGEVIIKFKDSATEAGVMKALTAVESEVQEELPVENLVVTDVPEGETVETFIEDMEERSDVEYAQPNYVYHIERDVNDPYAIPSYQWYLDTIGVYDAWDVTMGSSDIKVAVLDSGIDLDHPEFAGQICDQYDYINRDNVAQDDDGHGTHVAGIIAAVANNGIGVAGIAPGVKLIAVKVLDLNGSGTTAGSISGINFAISCGADVINMSYGGYYADFAQEAVVNNATNAGIVCVAAAGNDSTSKYSSPSDIESCISVMATDYYDNIAEFSDYGPYKDISAPGCSIFSTYNSEGSAVDYCSMSGTSMASPVVAGVAALVLSVNPNLSVNQVKDILYSTAADLGIPGKDYYYGYGRISAAAAVYKTKLGTPAIHSAVSSGYNSISLAWNKLESASGYEVWRSTSAGGTYSIVAPHLTGTTYVDTGLSIGIKYYYKIKAYCSAGTSTVFSDFSAYAFATPIPSKPSPASAVSASYSSIRVSWSAVSGASGYQLYRTISPSGTYSHVKTTSSTSYTNSSLKTGTTYYYKVRAYKTVSGKKVYGDFSVIVSAAPTLSKVTGVSAVMSSPTTIKIKWSSVSGKSGYQVFRSTSPTGVFTYVGTTTRTYFSNSKLTPNITYYYKVKAYRTVSRKKIYGQESDVKSAMPVFATVSGAKASMYSVTSNKVTWGAVSGRKGYEVWRSELPDSGYTLADTTTKTYYIDKYRVPNKMYYYRIRAYVMVGKTKYRSGDSNTASAMPVFGSVGNVTGTASSPTSSKLTWGAVSGRSGYEILRSTSLTGTYKVINSTTRTYYTDSKCLPGTTYYYKVRAYVTVKRIKRYSNESVPISVTPNLKAVTGAKAVVSSSSKIKLTWSSVSGRTKYEILRSDTYDGAYSYISSTTSTYYYNSGLTAGKTYYYKIRAYKLINKVKYYGGESAIVSATP